MPACTYKPSIVLVAMETLIKVNQQTLQLEDIWIPDQDKIPRTPALTLEGGNYTRELAGAPYRTNNRFEIQLLLYHSDVLSLNRETYIEAMQLAENTMDVIHSDLNLGGLVIEGNVEVMDPGVAARGTTKSFAHRFIWRGLSKTNIPTETEDNG